MNQACFLLFVINQVIAVLCASVNDVIHDYFSYRKVHRIVGFSCGTIEDDFKLTKRLNNIDAYASLWGSKSLVVSSVNTNKLLSADYHQLGIFLDLRCRSENYTSIFHAATKYSMYDEMHKWLILGQNLSHNLQMLNDETFSVSTDVVIATVASDAYTLYDVYNPCKDRGGSMNVTRFGTWTAETGLVVSLTQSKFERRKNLNGMRLKVGIAVNYKPDNMSLHDMMLEYSMKAKYGRSKFLYILLLHIADLYNFTMDIVQITTQRRFDNSAPVFAAFQKKLLDLSASPVTMKVDRLSYGDIIGPNDGVINYNEATLKRSCFMFRTISSTKMKPAQFLKPLNVKVWYVILAMIGIATTVLLILLKLEGVNNPLEGYGISVLITIGALSQQGSAFVPTHYAGRIAFLQIMFFSLLILNYYSASVVSDRLRNIGEKMNDSLISLAKSNMKIAVEPTPYIRSFLQVPTEEVRYFYENRWIKLPESNRYLPLDEGLDRVAEGSLAYHAMIDSAYPYIEHSFSDRSICELTEVHLYRANLALYVRHKSPFSELMRIGMTKIRNVGIQKRELRRWSARTPFCPSNLLIAEPLSIHEAAPVFIFLCSATTISLVLCVVENFVYWIWPARIKSSIMEKRRLIAKNVKIPSLRDVHLQALRRFNVFRRTSVPSPQQSPP